MKGAIVRGLAVAPVVAATAVLVYLALIELAGRPMPMSLGPPRNVAEAAGLGLGPEILRFLRAGQRTDQVFELRSEVISSTVRRATALEAAVWSNKAQVMDLLGREGALQDPAERTHAYCLALDVSQREIADFLAKNGESGPCEAGATLAAVLARSK